MKEKNLVIAFLGSPVGVYISLKDYSNNYTLNEDITVKEFLDFNGFKYSKDLNLGRYLANGIHGFFINCGEIVGILVDSVRLLDKLGRIG